MQKVCVVAIFVLLLVMILIGMSYMFSVLKYHIAVRVYETVIKEFHAKYYPAKGITLLFIRVRVRYLAVSGSVVGVYVEMRRLDTGAVVYSGVKSAVVSGNGCSEFVFEVSRDIGCYAGVKLECVAVGFVRFRELYNEKIDLAVTVVTKN